MYVEIHVDWQVYNIPEDKDDNVIDVITTVGPHFPNHTHSHTTNTSPHVNERSKHNNANAGMESGRSSTTVGMEPGQSDASGGMEQGHSDASGGMEPGHSDASGGMEPGHSTNDDPIVCVFLRGHEGTRANKPFNINPTQMVQ